MAKIHKSLRVDEVLAARVRASVRDGEPEAAAWVRAIEAGLDALAGEGREAGEGRAAGGEPVAGGVALEYIETLKEQLAVKDDQIRRLQESQAVSTLALTARAGGGAWTRVKGFFARNKEQQ